MLYEESAQPKSTKSWATLSCFLSSCMVHWEINIDSADLHLACRIPGSGVTKEFASAEGKKFAYLNPNVLLFIAISYIYMSFKVASDCSELKVDLEN